MLPVREVLLRLVGVPGKLDGVRRKKLRKTTLFEESTSFSASAETLELGELRVAFSRLFDEAARQVFLRGLDLDDVVVERLMECRGDDGTIRRVPLPSLTDRAAIVSILQSAGVSDSVVAGTADPWEVSALVARVVVEAPPS